MIFGYELQKAKKKKSNTRVSKNTTAKSNE